jgi:hypothetical protein
MQLWLGLVYSFISGLRRSLLVNHGKPLCRTSRGHAHAAIANDVLTLEQLVHRSSPTTLWFVLTYIRSAFSH